MILLTDAETLSQLQINEESPADIADIQLKMKAASLAVVKYLGEGATFLDESGECVPADVPEDIKQAAVVLVQYLYDGENDEDFRDGYLPSPVMSLLWPYRIPSLG